MTASGQPRTNSRGPTRSVRPTSSIIFRSVAAKFEVPLDFAIQARRWSVRVAGLGALPRRTLKHLMIGTRLASLFSQCRAGVLGKEWRHGGGEILLGKAPFGRHEPRADDAIAANNIGDW